MTLFTAFHTFCHMYLLHLCLLIITATHWMSCLLALPVQGTSKRLFPGFVKLGEKVAFCLPTAGRRTQFFHPTFSQPGKSLLEVPCTCRPREHFTVYSVASMMKSKPVCQSVTITAIFCTHHKRRQNGPEGRAAPTSSCRTPSGPG